MQRIVRTFARECIENTRHCYQMPTAILRYLTKDGFVIVADGKAHDVEKNVTVSTTVQKIFEIPGRPAAYALYGNIRFDDDDDESKSVNLAGEIERLVRSGAAKPPDLLSYGRQVAGPVHECLLKAKAEGHIRDYGGFNEFPNSGSTIARIFLYGYCDGSPSEVDVRFWHRDQVLENPQIAAFDFETGNPRPWGCPTIWNALRDNDPRVSQFRLTMPARSQSREISLWDAAKVGETYIRACDSDEGRAMEADCRLIGGHIHIAAITPTHFQWLKPPIEKPTL